MTILRMLKTKQKLQVAEQDMWFFFCDANVNKSDSGKRTDYEKINGKREKGKWRKAKETLLKCACLAVGNSNDENLTTD